jgi:hypothetical protein
MTVNLLAVAACVRDESAPLLQNFWWTLDLARALFVATADDHVAHLTSDQLRASNTSGGLGMSEVETRQVLTLLQSEGLLGGGNVVDTEGKYEWAFQIANRIHDYRDVESIDAYLQSRKEEQIPRSVSATVTKENSPATRKAVVKSKADPAPLTADRGRLTARKTKPAKKQGNPDLRPPVPPERADQVMFQSDRTCCVCRKPKRTVQIHHLDDERTHNKMDNLAALCLECHNRTQLKGGFGRKLNEGQIRLYRKEWYKIVKERRAGTRKRQDNVIPKPDRSTAKLDKQVLKYLESLKVIVDRITYALNNAYLAEQPTTLPINDYLTEFDRSQMLLSKDFAQECEDCYIAALQLTANLNNQTRIPRAINDKHEKFMTASRQLRESIVREARLRRGLPV